MHPLHSIPLLEGGIPHAVFFLKLSSLLINGALSCPLRGGLGVVINIWPVKPFETVTVIKGCTNKIDLMENKQHVSGRGHSN